MAAVTPPAAVVIGPGRVGRCISQFYKPSAPLIGRQHKLSGSLADGTPIWVCTTNDGLDSVLQHTAVTPEQRQQLIFVQNGMLLPWLRQHGLEHNTQVLLYMSASEDGRVSDGLRTAVCGPWAAHVASTLRANSVSCAVLDDWQQFQQAMLVKLLWSCIFWLLSAGLGGKPVGTIAQQHESEVAELVAELLPLGQDYLHSINTTTTISSSGSAQHQHQQHQQPQQQPQQQESQQQQSQQQQQQQQQGVPEVLPGLSQSAVLEQLLSYSLAIAPAVPSVEMASREFAWRNGFFLGLPKGHTPCHCDWLARAGCADLLINAVASC